MSDNKEDILNNDQTAVEPEATTSADGQQEQTVSKSKPRKKKTEEGLGELQQLLDEVVRLQKENKEQNDRYLRMLAEYDNFRKRSTADNERQKLVGITQTLTAVFPVIDSINRALEVLAGDDKAMAGIVQIKKQFDLAMQKIGVEQIPALGETFNPEVHNAVMQEENEQEAGKVIAVFQEGYKYKDYVIRPAMVKVAV
jgi:molecular chaperone GrpE